jgi:hypothetical protein
MLRRMLEGRQEAEQAARSDRAAMLAAALAEVDAQLADVDHQLAGVHGQEESDALYARRLVVVDDQGFAQRRIKRNTVSEAASAVKAAAAAAAAAVAEARGFGELADGERHPTEAVLTAMAAELSRLGCVLPRDVYSDTVRYEAGYRLDIPDAQADAVRVCRWRRMRRDLTSVIVMPAPFQYVCQDRHLCAIHAINNLLYASVFQADDFEDCWRLLPFLHHTGELYGCLNRKMRTIDELQKAAAAFLSFSLRYRGTAPGTLSAQPLQ